MLGLLEVLSIPFGLSVHFGLPLLMLCRMALLGASDMLARRIITDAVYEAAIILLAPTVVVFIWAARRFARSVC